MAKEDPFDIPPNFPNWSDSASSTKPQPVGIKKQVVSEQFVVDLLDIKNHAHKIKFGASKPPEEVLKNAELAITGINEFINEVRMFVGEPHIKEPYSAENVSPLLNRALQKLGGASVIAKALEALKPYHYAEGGLGDPTYLGLAYIFETHERTLNAINAAASPKRR